MKASFSSLLLAGLLAGVFCSKECIDAPETKYKGCSNQVGSYVLKTVNDYCKGAWSTPEKFAAAKDCFKTNKLNLQEALEDCTPEITRNNKADPNVDGYNAACPTGTLTDAQKFLQYHMNCCLINHALEFSDLTYDEALAVHKKCDKA